MIVVIFEVTGQPPQLDGYPDDVKIFHKENFIKVSDSNNQMLALYHPNRVIAIRRVEVPVKSELTGAPTPNAETVHPVNGTEGREDSPDR